MAINKNRVMETAQKLVEKGQLDKAIKEYLRIVEEDPKDVRVWLKLGDLHARKGGKQEATDAYLRVAQYYSDQGFYLKAVAVYKQVLRLDPRLIDVNIRLAEVYRQLGLLSDAMQQYELVAAFYHREGKPREALATVRELVELDPENVATRIKLAELYSKEQMVKEAVAEFAKAAEYLRVNGRHDDYIKVAERLVWHQPDNHVMNRELAQLYLRRNDPRHALQKLQVCFKADPRDVETLGLLAAAFLALDQRQKTVSVWKELARIHTENNQAAAAQDVYRRILSVVPDDAEALAASGGRRAVGTGNQPAVAAAAVQQQPAAPTSQPIPPQRLATPIGSEPGERQVMPRLATPVKPPDPAPPLLTLKGPARVATPISRPAPSEDAAVVEVDDEREPTSRSRAEPATLDVERPSARPSETSKLLEQADVYAKYGLRDKSLQQLQRVLEIDPRSVDARARLKDHYMALGRTAEASAELVRLVETLAPADRERAEGYLKELVALVPGDARARDLQNRYRLRPPQVAVHADPESDDLDIEVIPGSIPPGAGVSVDSVDVLLDAVSGGDETTDIGDEGIEIDAGMGERTMAGTVPSDFDGDGELDVEVGDPAADDDAELAFDDMTNAPTEHGDATVDISHTSLDDLGAMAEDEPLSGELSIDPSDEALAESMGPDGDALEAGEPDAEEEFAKEPATDKPVAPPTGIEDDLDEADFFVSQSLYDEARAILKELLTRHPGHPLIIAKLRDLPDDEPEQAPTSSSASAPGTSRKPTVIARPQGGSTDADTHYDLGLAYKEMGLFEEAVKEFALARQAQGRAVQSYLMIGLCQLELVRTAEAVEAFKAGLYVDGITDREAMALYFELGAAYEALGDAREALYYFEKVQKRDPRFRDVGGHIDALAKGAVTGAVRGNGAAAQKREGTDPGDVGEDALNALDSLLDEQDVTPR